MVKGVAVYEVEVSWVGKKDEVGVMVGRAGAVDEDSACSELIVAPS